LKDIFDDVQQGLYADPGIQNLDHFFNGEPSFLACGSKFLDGPPPKKSHPRLAGLGQNCARS
jgi:hypothetical protein